MADLIDVFDPEFIRCPFPAYDRARTEAAAVWVDVGRGFWLVTAHERVREVVADTETFSSQSGGLGLTTPSPVAQARIAALTPPGGLRGQVPTLLTLDPPAHSRNRKLIARAFTPRAARRYEERIRTICRELIAGWTDGGTVDFVTSFAIPLPVRVIAAGLDVPDDRVADFKRWSDAAVSDIGAGLDDDAFVTAFEHKLELAEFIQAEIERKRGEGLADDIMSQLVHARLDAEEQAELGGEAEPMLSDDEIQSIVRQLLVAGNETTTNLLSQLMVALAHDCGWWQRMSGDGELVGRVVEEGLRMSTPSAVNQRACTRDVDFHGVQMAAGDTVMVGYLAADHDPSVFPDPQRFDPDRENLGELLSFGRGVHFCPGASLARLEARVALEELVAALDGFELPCVGELEWNSSFQLRAIRELPMVPRFRPRSGGAR